MTGDADADSAASDEKTAKGDSERTDWGPWALVGGVALVAAAAIGRGAKKRLQNARRRE